MKIFLILLLFLSFVKADDMTRIDAIVADITELRSEYKECQKELKKQNNTILDSNLEYSSNLEKKNKALSKRIKKLEKELKSKNNLLKTKDKTIKKLKRKQDNFPELMMKTEFDMKKDELVRFKARSYHLKYDSIIYDGINGKMITKWMKTTSFTSSVKTKSWIKVTGYFVDKQWIAAKKDMWIKIKQVEKK